MNDELEMSFSELHDTQMYHTMSGCVSTNDGKVTIHEGIVRAIMNWCGNCTDPANGPDYYNNPRAMFTALNLIYKLLEEHGEGPQEYTLKGRSGFEVYHFSKMHKMDKNYIEALIRNFSDERSETK